MTLIGGGAANPVYAAFWHTVLVRYVDFMDNFLAPTETCHTADNFGVALTAAQLAGGTGRDLMLGVALGYTVQSRLVDHGNFMTRGFDHTAQLAFSHNAAAGRLLGMTEAQIANAIAMAASSDASFAVIRAKPLSQWKGLASAQSALGAMNALFLARRGVEGPLRVVEGPLGIDNLLDMHLRVDWDARGLRGRRLQHDQEVQRPDPHAVGDPLHDPARRPRTIRAWTSPPGSTRARSPRSRPRYRRSPTTSPAAGCTAAGGGRDAPRNKQTTTCATCSPWRCWTGTSCQPSSPPTASTARTSSRC